MSPEMREQGKKLILLQRARGWDWTRVDEAARTLEQQQEKVDQGYSETMDSPHLNKDGRGANAMHLIHRRYGYGDSSEEAKEYFRDYGAAAKSLGLVWGGDYEKDDPDDPYGWDPAHVEMKR